VLGEGEQPLIRELVRVLVFFRGDFAVIEAVRHVFELCKIRWEKSHAERGDGARGSAGHTFDGAHEALFIEIFQRTQICDSPNAAPLEDKIAIAGHMYLLRKVKQLCVHLFRAQRRQHEFAEKAHAVLSYIDRAL